MSVTIGNVGGGIHGSIISGNSVGNSGLLAVIRKPAHLPFLEMTMADVPEYQGYDVVVVAYRGAMRLLKDTRGSTEWLITAAELKALLEKHLLGQ